MSIYMVDNFTVQSGHHCLFSGLRHLLVRERPEFDKEVVEADIYFQSDGLNLEYNGNLCKMWLASQETIMRQFAACYGLHAQYTFELGPAVLDTFREIVRGNRAILIFMRSPYLDYHAVFRDGAEHNHILLLYGIDVIHQIAQVADTSFLDGSGQTLSYKGPLSLSHILAGVWGYAWFEVDPSHNPTPNADARFHRAVENIKRFCRGHILPEGRFQGLDAYRAYVADWSRLINMDPAEFTDSCKHMYYCLRVGGIMHQLDYFEMFIGKHRERVRDSDGMLQQLRVSQNEWKKSLYQLYKIGLSVQPHKLQPLQARYSTMLQTHEEWLEDFVVRAV
ncbi:hypothetical protein SAMN03159341_11023 [Paenibacillus sp. 1_12]|uniref:hypothetical protein n=1 Tax=Paenibacillus sp. 1_12 TaxID=1566278 RepID=UPI0008E52AA1|nr:hypothetical protein [Paenibacillus sp. 1_12]SFL80443.1 hypothetical protein SAMN03159341_11023 [Paenibacillus sp. 1_12]